MQAKTPPHRIGDANNTIVNEWLERRNVKRSDLEMATAIKPFGVEYGKVKKVTKNVASTFFELLLSEGDMLLVLHSSGEGLNNPFFVKQFDSGQIRLDASILLKDMKNNDVIRRGRTFFEEIVPLVFRLVFEDPYLADEFAKSTLSYKEFMRQKRGYITLKEFGL